MKRIILIIFLSFLVLLSTKVHAEVITQNDEDIVDKLTNAGSIPGDLFYKFDRFLESVSLIITFNEEKKVEKYMLYAEERLAEINQLDPEKDLEWLDKLFDDYGVTLNKTNDLLINIIDEGKINSNELKKMQNKLENITSKEERISNKAREKINFETKDKVEEVKVDSYLISISNKMTENEKKLVKEKNMSVGLLIKLISFSNLTGVSIDEIIEMDIYVEDEISAIEGKKEIDFQKMESILGIDKKQLMDNLKASHKSIIENRKAEKEKDKIDKQNGKTDEEKEKLKREIEKKQKEMQEKLAEMQEKFREGFKNNSDQEESDVEDNCN